MPSPRESSYDESLKATRPENVHRNSTAESTLSSFGPVAAAAQLSRSADDEEHVRERSTERRADPLGLNVVHEPDSTPTMDIILVHGLGGTSRKTWSRNRDAALFWPQEWLPYEPGFQTTRILSFGYNAHFAAAGRENILNIADFAKELLFGMKFALNERAEELHIGKVCPFRDDKGNSRPVKARKKRFTLSVDLRLLRFVGTFYYRSDSVRLCASMSFF